jgi:ABC-type dipeptide/oligopeptide/nickel transport system ATPase component
MIKIIKNEIPKMKQPKMNVDNILHEKLNNYPLLSTLNKSFILALIGKAGSGKSHFLISMLKSKPLMNKVFENIIIFIPPSSRSSIAGDFWDENLPEENIYDELTLENLMEAYEKCKENAKDGYKSLIIFDDVQKDFKGQCEKLLQNICNNRRHDRISIIFAVQSYKALSKTARNALTNLIIFKVNKTQMKDIFDEQIETMKEKFEEILNMAYKNPHEFLAIDTNSQRCFNNWDEVIIN